ncbi:MAG: HAD family hydrolase [Candidatus Dactylopiibacterium carminicum]|nr:HAD hydrolase-like protein [Candidatus Dactylopiibacterium carminicum]PAS96629.1 MAG: HAD family hydrolase [Candidatus Dactylopiibacterium carminicum]
MRHDVIVFDLDGTLSDPLEGIGRSINHALQACGYATHPLDELAIYIGPPLDFSFRELTGSQDEAHIAALVAHYRERYGSIGYAENALYAGIPEALAGLQARGCRIGLCTSKRVDFAEQILALFKLRQHFSFVSGGEIGTPKWQQLGALCQRGLVGPDSLMVGDRAVDMIAAHRNGLSAAGVLWGFGSQEELSEQSPRYLLSRIDELLTLG